MVYYFLQLNCPTQPFHAIIKKKIMGNPRLTGSGSQGIKKKALAKKD
jgi:hypothetical protein